jgi:hypothetical protein
MSLHLLCVRAAQADGADGFIPQGESEAVSHTVDQAISAGAGPLKRAVDQSDG